MRATKQMLTAVLITIASANPALAAAGEEGIGILSIVLLGLLAVVLLGQLLPGVFLLWGLIRGTSGVDEESEYAPSQNRERF